MQRLRRTVILLVDNYDSFTYNLAHLLQDSGPRCPCFGTTRSTSTRRCGGAPLPPRHLARARGPGDVRRDGRDRRRLAPRTPTLGVCLGHQAIVEAFGGESARPASSSTARRPDRARRRGVFEGLPSRLRGRALPLAGRDPCPGLPGGLGDDRRRRGDGRTAPRAPRRRNPVPSGIGAHAARPELGRNFLEGKR